MEHTAQIDLTLSLLLLSGLLFGLLASRFELPQVPASVLAGILFSPALLGGMLGLLIGGWSEPLTSVALGIIAYLIGGSITVDQLRRTGKIIVILSQACVRDLCIVTETGSIAGHLSHKKHAHLLLAEHRLVHTRRQLIERVAIEDMPVIDTRAPCWGVINLSAVLREMRREGELGTP